MHYSIPVVALAALVFSATAQADGYFALEGSAVSVADNPQEQLNPMGLRLRLGTRIGQSFDIEGHVGFAVDEDTDSFEEFSASYVGAYLKAYVPLGFNSALFGAAGYTRVELGQTIGGREFVDDRAGFSYGFGMETQLSDRVDLTADYMRYLQGEGLFEELSAVSFGIKVYF